MWEIGILCARDGRNVMHVGYLLEFHSLTIVGALGLLRQMYQRMHGSNRRVSSSKLEKLGSSQ